MGRTALVNVAGMTTTLLPEVDVVLQLVVALSCCTFGGEQERVDRDDDDNDKVDALVVAGASEELWEVEEEGSSVIFDNDSKDKHRNKLVSLLSS